MLSSWHWSANAIPSSVAIAVCLVVGLFVVRRRASPGATGYLAMLAGCIIWLLFQALGCLAATLELKTLMAELQFVGIAFTPALFLVFAMSYCDIWPRRQVLWVTGVLAIPAISALLGVTNSVHQLVFRELAIDDLALLPAITVAHGPWFSLHTLTSYLAIVIAIALLLRKAGQAPSHAWSIALLVLLPVIVGALNVLHLMDIHVVGQGHPREEGGTSLEPH